jgi:aminocarboxymuconate-semialdehyde decarboxylase
MAGATAGAFLLRDSLLEAMPQIPNGVAATKHRPVMIGGKRIKTVDAHAHVLVQEMPAFLKGTSLERASASAPGGQSPLLSAGSERLMNMDFQGIDVQALMINDYWYSSTDRDLVTRLIEFQNQKLAEKVKEAVRGRFVAYSTVAMQFPELAATQLEDGMKMGLKGASICGSVPGKELSGPEYDVFWAKAEQLQAPIFMHPQGAGPGTGTTDRIKGPGALGVSVANPLETTLFMTHMVFDGVLERHPGLKVCCAHGGGYLPSYADRMDHGCGVFPQQCAGSILKKMPSEYLKQFYVDSLVFTPEALRHLVAVMGPTHVMIGTDNPIPWTESGPNWVQPVDHVLATPGLTDAQRIQILSGNACKWLGIPT